MALPAIAWAGVGAAATYGPRAVAAAAAIRKGLGYGATAAGIASDVKDVVDGLSAWATPAGSAAPPPGGASQSSSSGGSSGGSDILNNILQQAGQANSKADELKYALYRHIIVSHGTGVGSYHWFEPHSDTYVMENANGSAVRQSQVNALLTKNMLGLLIDSLTHYSLDTAGLAAYRADKAAGIVSGDGLLVERTVSGYQTLALNPEVLCVESPSGDLALPVPRLLVEMLNRLPVFPRP